MTGAAAAAAEPSPDSSFGASPLMSIGEVLARLREDFPDITISKLRFLEAEGLVDPKRTSAGYRKYSHVDVERLGFVLAAQRDRFLPLRVIRDQLDALDRGEQSALDGFPAYGLRRSGPAPLPGEASAPTGESRLHRDDVLKRSGLDDRQLAELEDAGLVIACTPGWYDADAIIIATVAANLAALGIGARHLRAYRAGADREVGLFTALIAPLAKSSSPAAHARAAEALRELTSLSQQLHAALVRVGLRGTLGQ